MGQGIQHRQLLGHPHRIAQRDDRAPQGNRDLVQVRSHMRSNDDGRWAENPSGVVVLGKADLVEAELYDQGQPFEHTPEGLRTKIRIINPGGQGPLRRHFLGVTYRTGSKNEAFMVFFL